MFTFMAELGEIPVSAITALLQASAAVRDFAILVAVLKWAGVLGACMKCRGCRAHVDDHEVGMSFTDDDDEDAVSTVMSL